MEIKTLTLENLGRFKHLELTFAPTEHYESNVTVFIGNNGAGKTSILKALATSLSWFVARVSSQRGNGRHIDEIAIINEMPSASIGLQVEDSIDSNHDDGKFEWRLVKVRKGHKSEGASQLNELTELADSYRENLTQNPDASLPLIAFYPVERAVLEVPLDANNHDDSSQIDGYDKGLTKGVEFQRFFEWFRLRDDIKNEAKVSGMQSIFQGIDGVQESDDELDAIKLLYSQGLGFANATDTSKQSQTIVELINSIDKIKSRYQKLEQWQNKIGQIDKRHADKQLSAVKRAIRAFIPELTDIRVQRRPKLRMVVEKNGEALDVMQLSQGERTLMALIGDIARRLAMMNPALDDPLQGDGIIMIDEVDMHLHPIWQRRLVQSFTATFPNCQIILTTHSPLVISEQKSTMVYLLEQGEAILQDTLYGEDANSVLLKSMDTPIRNLRVDDKLNDIFSHIQSAKLDKANTLIAELEHEVSASNIELAKAKLLLRKKELQLAKNR